MSHTWIHNPETGGHWQCPDGMIGDLLAGGWELCDPPAEHSPATAEHAAWREAQAVEAAAVQKKAAKPKPTQAAVGGESQED